MDAEPLVSVIVPLYRSAAYVERMASSVLGQTHGNLELLCVDDCSPDDTAEAVRTIAARDQRVRLLSHVKNQGAPAYGRNTGLAAASGEFVTFLDHDDTFLPTKLERLLELMRAESLDFACSNCLLVRAGSDQADMPAWSGVRGNVRAGFAARLLQDNFVPPNSTLIRREAVTAVGGFDTSLRGVDDYDLWYRIARRAACGLLNVPLATWTYRNEASISADQSLMIGDEIRFYQKIAELPDASEAERSVASEQIRRDYARLGNQRLLAGDAAGAARNYDTAGKPALRRAAQYLPALLRAAYAVKRRMVPTFSPIDLIFPDAGSSR